jgi:hypothetical protein
MTASDPEMTLALVLVGAGVGAVLTGMVGLSVFFIKRYFVTRDQKQDATEVDVSEVKLVVAGVEARMDEHLKLLLETRDDVKHIRCQIVKIFSFIDAKPQRTDLKGAIS